jgi:ribosomal protein L40E
MDNNISTLITAGGKIICRRCTAKSKRSGEQCKKPALKTSRTQKCQFHGGRSTGPQTEAGKARQRAAVTTYGHHTKEAIEARARSARVLAGLEDALYILRMTDAPRTRGRKPLGHVPLKAIDDVVQFAADNPLHLPERSGKHRQK